MTMTFKPLKGFWADGFCDILEIQENERREWCYGQEFKPVPLGAPCTIIPVERDGNSLFRALSFAICGHDTYHLRIRQKCVDQMFCDGAASHIHQPNMFPKEFETVEKYIREMKMAKPGSQTTRFEIDTLANRFGLPIYTYSEGKWFVCKPHVVELKKDEVKSVTDEVKPEKVKRGKVKLEKVKREKVKREKVKQEKAKQEEVKLEKVKREKAKQEEVKREEHTADINISRGGIYLAQEGIYYSPVVCVMRPGFSDCYGFCMHTNRRKALGACSHCEPRALSSRSGNSFEYEPDVEYHEPDMEYYEPDTEYYEPDMEYYENEMEYHEHAMECDQKSLEVEENAESENVDPDKNEACATWNAERICDTVTQEDESGELKSDKEIVTIDEKRCDHAWKGFLKFLHDRWWGNATLEDIIAFLETEEGTNAMIVSEPLDAGEPGALCSLTSKGNMGALRKDVISLDEDVYVSNSMYGYFESPDDALIALLGLRHRSLAAKPLHVLSSLTSYFSDADIPVQLRVMREELGKAWWGTISHEEKLRVESVLKNLPSLNMRTGPRVAESFAPSDCPSTRRTMKAAAVMKVTDVMERKNGPGYLFEIVVMSTPPGRANASIVRHKVVFSARGISLLSEEGECLDEKPNIVILLYSIAKTLGLLFVEKP